MAEEQGTVDKALVTFRDFMADKEMEWFKKNLKDAKALLIVPNLLKAGFILGGSGGSGVLVARDAKTGNWSQPAFYTVGSVTFGLQIGGGSSGSHHDDPDAESPGCSLYNGIQAGRRCVGFRRPVGVGSKANVTADVVSFAKSKGLFAGLNLEGSVLKVNATSNKDYYQKAVSPLDIVVKNAASNPGTASLLAELKKAAK